MGEYLQLPNNHIWSSCIGWLLQRVLFVASPGSNVSLLAVH